MLIASCPLRISLLGGSTDLEDFIKKYGYGQVISFPVNLYTYVSINKRYDNKFLIQYSKTEAVNNISEIKNDVVRVVLEYFNIKTPITVAMNADIPSYGSGLAASSSFIISMIKATSIFKGLNLSDYEICDLALLLERKFNPLVGRQDPNGCGLKGFKHLHFSQNKPNRLTLYDHTYFSNFNFNLISVGAGRKSTDILKSLNLDKRQSIYDKATEGVKSIESENYKQLNELISSSWEDKKLVSPLILNDDVLKIENKLQNKKEVVSYKLCGAGGGGYMFVVSKKSQSLDVDFGFKVNIDNRGIRLWKLCI